MSVFEIVAVLLAGLSIAAYFERLALKADVVKAEGRVVDATHRFIKTLRDRELALKSKIAADISKVFEKAKAEANAVELAVLKQIEEDVKKVL